MATSYYNKQSYSIFKPKDIESYKPHLDRLFSLSSLNAEGQLSILDIAAGAGLQSEYLVQLGASVTAIDHSPGSLEQTTATKFHIPFSHISSSLGIFHGIHIKDALTSPISPADFFTTISEIISPGGIVMICMLTEDALLLSRTLRLHSQINSFENTLFTSWKPAVNEQDWYEQRPLRTILHYQYLGN